MKKIIGIDVGTRSTKLVLLKISNKKNKILKAVTIQTPEGCVQDGDIMDIKALAEAIKAALKENKIKAGEIAITFTSSHTIIRELRLPKLEEYELDSAAEFQLAQTFPGISETHTISFKIYERTDTEFKGIITFAPNTILNKYTALGDLLKIPVKYIDIASNSVAKCFHSFISDKYLHGNVILVDIGYKNTQIHLISNGKRVLLSRNVDGGAYSVDLLIAESYNTTLKDAESIKMGQASSVEMSEDELLTYTRLGTIGIEEQIRHTLEFFTYNKFEGQVGTIFLSGNGSRLVGLQEYLFNTFNIQTEYVSTSEKIVGLKDNSSFHIYLNAIGAAIREDIGRWKK